MGKMLVISNTLDIKDILPYVDGFIFGIKGFSINFLNTFEIKELKDVIKLLKKEKKEIYLSLEKNITSLEIDNLKTIIKEIENLNIQGIFFADNCFLELNIKTPLIWAQEHLTTNYETINNYKEFGVNGTYLSSEITLKEIEEIIKNTTVNLYMPIFGFQQMFTSKRHIVKNYLNYFKLKDKSKIKYMEKENKYYPIIDTNEGTIAYTSNILNGYEEYIKLNNISFVFNDFNIEKETFKEVLNIYHNKLGNEKIEKLISNIDKGFLYKETIYKIKK